MCRCQPCREAHSEYGRARRAARDRGSLQTAAKLPTFGETLAPPEQPGQVVAAADRLMKIATDRGLAHQAAVLGAFPSDASHSKASGLTPRAGLLRLPS